MCSTTASSASSAPDSSARPASSRSSARRSRSGRSSTNRALQHTSRSCGDPLEGGWTGPPAVAMLSQCGNSPEAEALRFMKWHKGCGTSGRRPTSVGAALRRVRLLTATDAGIGLIETLIALLIFAVVSTALIGVLVSATTSTKVSKDQTIAEQGVASEIEMIKNWAATPDPNSNSSPTYDDIGTNPNGNPYGALPQSQVFTGVNGESLGTPAHMTISVSFASANVPGAYTNGIDYKKVTVTITRDVDSKVLS